MPMQKQTCAGQWTRFKAFVTTEVYYRPAGLGVKHSMEVATAILRAIIQARLFITPCDEATGDTRSASPNRPLQGDYPLWLYAGASHPHPQGHWHHLGPYTQEAAADGTEDG